MSPPPTPAWAPGTSTLDGAVPAGPKLLAVDALSGLPSTEEPRRRRRVLVPAEDHDEFQRIKAQRAARRRFARRLVAVAGAVGVLVVGGTFAFKDLPDVFDPDHGPRVVAQEDWESQARISLASINSQLDTIAATQAVWDSQIAQLFPGGPPLVVQDMLARRTLLEQQRAALQSQLATADQLLQTRAQLAQVDRQLAQIESTLDALPAGNLTPDQVFVRDSLRARRDLLVQERSSRRDDVDRLQRGVATAETSPVPDPTDQTTALTGRVLDLRDHRPGPQPSGPPPAPPVTDRAERRDPGVLADGAPPESRKPVRSVRPVTDSVEGTTGSVVEPVRAVAESSNTSQDAGSSSESDSGSSAASSATDRKSSSPTSSDSDSSGAGEQDGTTPARASGSTPEAADGSEMTPAQAYGSVMNSPSGRMARFIGGASGSPIR